MRLRRRCPFKQSEVAKRLGVSPSRVGNWFQGRNRPNDDEARRLALLLNESVDFLLYGILPKDPTGLDSVREEQAPYGVQAQLQYQAKPGMPPAPEPTDQQLVDYFLASLSVARQVPGGRGYVWSQLKMNLSPDQIKRLGD